MSMVTEILFDVPGTAHILGGCPMAASPAEGVVDARNRLFGYRNLYVCDGSVIAANLGVNPSLTICALTERAMSYIGSSRTSVPRVKPLPNGRGSMDLRRNRPSEPRRQGGVNSCRRSPMFDLRRLMLDVLAEIEARAHGEPHGEPAVFQQVVEQVIVDQVRLRAPADMLGEEDIEAAAESDKQDVVGLVSRRRQLRARSAV